MLNIISVETHLLAHSLVHAHQLPVLLQLFFQRLPVVDVLDLAAHAQDKLLHLPGGRIYSVYLAVPRLKLLRIEAIVAGALQLSGLGL